MSVVALGMSGILTNSVNKNVVFKILKNGKMSKNIWIMERKRSCGFRCIFAVAFRLFIAPRGRGALALQGIFSNPVGQIINIYLT